MMKFKNIENKYYALDIFVFMVKVIITVIGFGITMMINSDVAKAIFAIVMIIAYFNRNRINYFIINLVTTDEEIDELLSYHEEREL